MFSNSMRRRTALGALLSATLLAGAPGFAQDEPVTIGVVVKIGGIPWFNSMEAGIAEKAEELGAEAFMIGPTSNDPALQVRAIEDLIAQGVDVIGVVPNDAGVLEPVLKRAMDAGIKVILVDNDIPVELMPQEQGDVSDEVEQTQTDWMSQLVRSVTEAGLAQTVAPPTIGVPDPATTETPAP